MKFLLTSQPVTAIEEIHIIVVFQDISKITAVYYVCETEHALKVSRLYNIALS